MAPQKEGHLASGILTFNKDTGTLKMNTRLYFEAFANVADGVSPNMAL
jgi:hypothetical protein